MAINKTAKNLTIKVKNSYVSSSGTLTKISDSVVVESSKENLSLVSNMKIQTIGEKMNKTTSGTQEKTDNSLINNLQTGNTLQKQVTTGVYFNYDGNVIHNGGINDEYWLIDEVKFNVLKKGADELAKKEKLKGSEKKKFVHNEINKELIKANSGRIRLSINNNEGVSVPQGDNTPDFIYRMTNQRNNELSYNIVINTSTFLIEYGNPRWVGATGGVIYIKEGKNPTIANIHGHPDKKNNRADGSYHTMPGESEDDKNAAGSRGINGAVFNIEKGDIYYYTPNTYGKSPSKYTGGRMANDIILFAINVKINL